MAKSLHPLYIISIAPMIMIVDDNSPMRAVIREYLVKIGCDDDFIECTNGREAVESFRRLRPDWVLMDVSMAEMDGITATAAIRRMSPDAKILIVTNYDDPDLQESARTAGASGYVVKENLAAIRHFLPPNFT
jgi:CheY-like chemotaxis protein